VRWLLLVVSLLLLPVPAFADEAAARAAFKKGIELYDKKQYADALTSFQEAYKEKPSGGIKQNIALCLKGLNKPVEAATAFDEALDEGKDTLKPDTKAAIERELAELSKTVATVNITVTGDAAATVISVQPVGQAVHALPPGAQRRPIRLMPGLYIFSAKIPGQPTPEPKKLALISGAPTEVTFGISDAPTDGTLIIKTNVPDASIRVDGAEVGKGTWKHAVPSTKPLHIEVSAPGYRSTTVDVQVAAGATMESPITLQPIGSAPAEYTAPLAPPPAKPRRVYIAVTGSLEGMSYRLSPAMGEPGTNGAKRGFGGGSLGARFGFLYNKLFALEAFVEAGAGSSKVTAETDSTTHVQLLPMLRFQTPGKVRFTAGAGIGLHWLSVERKPTATTTTPVSSSKASGIAAVFLLDSGVQFDVGPLFLEAVLYLSTYGVGSANVDGTDRRGLLDSPAVQAGLRVGLGIPF
jgi:hypothetical protein